MSSSANLGVPESGRSGATPITREVARMPAEGDLSAVRKASPTAEKDVARGDNNNGGPQRTMFQETFVDFALEIHFPNFCQGLSNGVCAPVLPLFCRALGASDAVIGYILSVNGIGKVLSDIPASIASEMFCVRHVMVFSAFVFAVGTFVAVMAPTYHLVGVASVLFGASFGTYFTSRHFFLVDAIEKSKRGRLFSWIGGMQRWALVFGPALGGYLAELYSPKTALLACFPMTAVQGYLTWRSPKIRKNDERLATEKQRKLEARRAAGEDTELSVLQDIFHHFKLLIDATWENRSTAFGVGGFAIMIIAMRNCRRMFLPLAAMNLDLSPSEVGKILSISFMVDSSLFFVGGLISDRFGRRAAAIPTATLYGISFFLLSIVETPMQLVAVAIMFGSADVSGAGLLLTLIADVTPPGAKYFMGALRLIMDIGGFLGPFMGGALIHAFDFNKACRCLSLVGFTAALWCFFLVGETGDRSKYAKTKSENESPNPDVVVIDVALQESIKAQKVEEHRCYDEEEGEEFCARTSEKNANSSGL